MMAARRQSRTALLWACVLLGLSGVGIAQDAGKRPTADPKPCSVIPEPDPCSASPKPAGSQNAPAAMDKFPFPGAGAASAPSLGIGAPSAPEPPTSGSAPATSPADATKKFPFPGTNSAEPTTGSEAPAVPQAGTSGSSSSSSSSSSDTSADPFGDADKPDLKDAGSEGSQKPAGGHILHRAAPVVKPQTASEREEEDLRVANFNLNNGNIRGAYLRAQDAVKTMPDDPEAHFALAEMAARLGKKDEAITEYKACLQLDPPEERRKASTKALDRLTR